MKTVEYWLACEWICEECGRNNFSSMITPELPEEEEQEIKENLGIESWESGQVLGAPDIVTCKFCKKTFLLEDFSDGNPDDDPDSESWRE